jgi:hypothetical protein
MCELQKPCTRDRLCEILRRFGDHASRVTALLLQSPRSFATTLETLCSFRMFRIHFLSSGSLSHHLKMGMLA